MTSPLCRGSHVQLSHSSMLPPPAHLTPYSPVFGGAGTRKPSRHAPPACHQQLAQTVPGSWDRQGTQPDAAAHPPAGRNVGRVFPPPASSSYQGAESFEGKAAGHPVAQLGDPASPMCVRSTLLQTSWSSKCTLLRAPSPFSYSPVMAHSTSNGR